MTEYKDWKKEVNNNLEVKKRGDVLVNRDWKIIKDIILMFFIIILLLFIGIYVLYPENFRDVISNNFICDPNVTVVAEPDNLYTNVTCNNVCPAFPSSITIEMVNGT